MVMTAERLNAYAAEDDDGWQVRDPWTRRVIAVGLAVAFAVLVAVALLPLFTGGPGQVTRTEFTNKAKQHCTQVTTTNAVAITCSYKPAESRLGDALGL